MNKLLRRLMQLSLVVFVLYLSYAHQKYGIEKAAPIDAYCPFGAVEGFLSYIVSGDFLQRLFTSSFILGVIIIIATLLFGRVFCSYICPLGALSEWMRGLGRKLGIRKDVEFPERIDKYFRYLKYLILFVIIYFSFQYGDLVFRGYDPFNALAHLGEEFSEKIVGYSLLILILVASLFSKGWWCRYFCPMGAFLGIVRKLSPFNLKRDKETCVSCSKCKKICPAHINVDEADRLRDADCISCFNCIDDCPGGSLSARFFNLKFSNKYFSILVIVFFVVSLAIATSLPMWQTKVKSNITSEVGAINPDNIKGSNSLEFVIRETGVGLDVFVEKIGLPKDIDTSILLKEIGRKYNIKDEAGVYVHTELFRQVVRDEIERRSFTPVDNTPDCPFGVEDDKFPGECGLYVDRDRNGVCDYSE